MTDIAQQLREHAGSDHVRGCQGRSYSCDCGYDIKSEGLLELAAAEIERLNKWADGFADAQLKERRLCEARIQEMQSRADKLTLTLMMIREGCADPARFAGERLSALSSGQGTE